MPSRTDYRVLEPLKFRLYISLVQIIAHVSFENGALKVAVGDNKI